jgi:hypothetical protein
MKMSNENNTQDPLEFVRGMWNNLGFPLPGMVTPTLDVDELDKRIKDLKAVEHWLKMNLNMLQMTTQGLEMQRAALAAVRAMSTQGRKEAEEEEAAAAAAAERAAAAPGSNPFMAAAGMWPWNLMSAQQATPPEEDPPASAEDGEGDGEGEEDPPAPRKTGPGRKRA